MSLKSKIICILWDRDWHSSIEILRTLSLRYDTTTTHHIQRISDLRLKDGIDIEIKYENGQYWYKLMTDPNNIDFKTCKIKPDQSSVPQKSADPQRTKSVELRDSIVVKKSINSVRNISSNKRAAGRQIKLEI